MVSRAYTLELGRNGGAAPGRAIARVAFEIEPATCGGFADVDAKKIGKRGNYKWDGEKCLSFGCG